MLHLPPNRRVIQFRVSTERCKPMLMSPHSRLVEIRGAEWGANRIRLFRAPPRKNSWDLSRYKVIVSRLVHSFDSFFWCAASTSVNLTIPGCFDSRSFSEPPWYSLCQLWNRAIILQAGLFVSPIHPGQSPKGLGGDVEAGHYFPCSCGQRALSFINSPSLLVDYCLPGITSG
jgi:hypothetical protein